MKFYNIKDVTGFFNEIMKCEGRVELVTSEGDRLNLKSKLCQYIAFSKIIDKAEISEIEIVTSSPDDGLRLMRYMME